MLHNNVQLTIVPGAMDYNGDVPIDMTIIGQVVGSTFSHTLGYVRIDPENNQFIGYSTMVGKIIPEQGRAHTLMNKVMDYLTDIFLCRFNHTPRFTVDFESPESHVLVSSDGRYRATPRIEEFGIIWTVLDVERSGFRTSVFGAMAAREVIYCLVSEK